MTEPDRRQQLCRIEELPDPGSRGFTLRTEVGLKDIFVVRRGSQVYAYFNRCPHTGSPLDWQPDQFLSLDGSMIQCATHLAMFRIEDGYCLAGPCAGQTLTPTPIVVVDGRVLAAADEAS